MKSLVERYGWRKLTAISALLWALPLSAWAGGVDFDSRAWWGFYIGAVLLVAWLAVTLYARRWAAPPAKSLREEWGGRSIGWTGAFIAFVVGIIGWLNAAATVDLTLLKGPLSAGSTGAWVFSVAMLALLALLIGGAVFSWRRR